ncbi:hypothetical protein C1H46_000391 [Malus baccata]|uniref:Aminotransferase-like plant mobile domain-containing protein n=1 Tax=Malus baccata TaxID=106549 RepID=A0A540NSI9_MALBA|nr:hypothetical protein C1H46_000391 [Malus baccata]
MGPSLLRTKFDKEEPSLDLVLKVRLFNEEEPSLDLVHPIDPKRISRCCINSGLFPAMLIHFEFSYGTGIGWADLVDTEPSFVNQRASLTRAKVLDAIFMTKKQIVCLEPKFHHHVVKRWSKETHTFVCAEGESTPTLEDVTNIMHLPIVGCLVFYDNKDTFSRQVIPWAMAIARGHVVSLASLFFGLFYHELDQLQTLEDVMSIPLFKNLDFPSLIKKLLTLLAPSIPFQGEDSEERSAFYFPFQCFSAITKFHSDKQSRLSPNVVSHPKLMLEHMTASSCSKHRCPIAVEERNALGDCSRSTKKSKASGVGKGKPTAKTHANEIAHAGHALRTSNAQASSSSSIPKPFKFLDITTASKEERSAGETEANEVADEGMAAEENSNTSADSDLRSGGHPQASLGKDIEGEDNGRELSSKDGSKAAKDVDLHEVKGFLNDEVEAKDTKVCFPILRSY